MKLQCKIYRNFIGRVKTSRGYEREYWEIIINKNSKIRTKIVTAYRTSSMEYAIINNRIETKVEYKKH